MIQGDFSAVEVAKAEGFSGGQFYFGVQTFDNITGKLSFGPKPVEQEDSVARSILATRCMGSIFDRMARVHH